MKSILTILWTIVVGLTIVLSYSYWRIVQLEKKTDALQEALQSEVTARTQHALQIDTQIGDITRKSQDMQNNLSDLTDRVWYLQNDLTERVEYLEYRQGLLVELAKLKVSR